jgi:cytochrome P450
VTALRTEPPGPSFRVLMLVTVARRHLPPERFRKLSKDFPRIASLGVGSQKVYLVSDPDLVREVLVSKSRFVEKGPALRAAGLVLGNGLLTLPNAVHKPRRRLVNPSFHHARMAGYAEVMTTAIDEMDAVWQTWPDGTLVDMAEQMSALTLAIVGRALFGSDLDGSAKEVYGALERAMAGWEKLMLPGGDRLVALPIPAFKRMHAAAETLTEIVRKLVHSAVLERRDDVVSDLLDASVDGESLPQEAVQDEAMTLMLAGHETTANALAWGWHLLSGSPTAAGRLREEARSFAQPPTYADLRQLPWAMACVAESMRLYPPAWVLEREVTEDLELDGYVLTKGSIVLTSQYALHRDPRFWDRPTEFLPGRWITPDGAFDEDHPGQPRGAWFPFGAGTRQCIGESFAWTETALVLARLARTWAPVSLGTPRLHAAVTLRPEGGLPMQLRRAAPPA